VDYSLGKHVAEVLREAGLKVEFHTDHFAEDAEDTVWIPEVGSRGWVVLTKDKAIRRHPEERDAVMEANVGMFILPSGNLTGQEMADMYHDNRLDMARFLRHHPPPFLASVSSSGIRLIHPQPSS
jgi:hypothetical protein